MNAADQYKYRIEEIVHPINASQRRKNTMRRELWAHFNLLAEEEGGDAAACERAWERLGDSAEIRRELDASVAKFDRSYPELERYVLRSPTEPFARFALRLGGVAFTFAGTILVLALIAVLLLAPNLPVQRATVVFGFLLPLMAWLYCLLLFLQPAMRFALDVHAHRRAARPSLTALRKTIFSMLGVLLLAPVFCALGYGLTGLLLGFRHPETLAFLYTWPLACGFVWSQITAAVTFASWFEVHRAETVEDWPYA